MCMHMHVIRSSFMILMICINYLYIIPLAERERLDYLHSIEICQGVFYTSKRDNIFDDVIEM